MRIHLVYAGSPDSESIQSPYSITKNLYYYLKARAHVMYHDWTSRANIEALPNDIVIGHPNYDSDTIISKFFRSGQKCKAKCLIHPLHTVRIQDNLPFDPLAQAADKIFSICGPYWYDTIGDTPFAHWKPKITRLDMAVDANVYPYLKTEFNPIGKRKLIYMGSSTPHKNLSYMIELLSRMPDITLNWYGGDGDHPLAKLPNVKTVGWVVLDKNMATNIVQECDIFVNTSFSDANPTTLLESTAWGLIPACTPQSGYYNDPMFTPLNLWSIDESVSAIRKLLNTPSEVLKERSIRSRAIIESKYNWNVFCETVWKELEKLYAA